MLPGVVAHSGSFEWARHDSVDRARYRTDFEILSILGQGTFGTTYKVRNRIDDRIYAMKAVKLSAAGIGSDERTRVLREVQVLSSLNSEHVVRYYAAWVEKADMSAASATAYTAEFSGDGAPSDSTHSSEAPDSTFACNLCGSSYNDWEARPRSRCMCAPTD